MKFSKIQLEQGNKLVNRYLNESVNLREKATSLLKYFECDATFELKELLEKANVEKFDSEKYFEKLENELDNFSFLQYFFEEVHNGENLIDDISSHNGEDYDADLKDTIQEIFQVLQNLDNEISLSNYFYFDGCEYKACGEYEIDELFNDYVENIIEEIVLHEIPERYHHYFDRDSYRDDIKYHDGYEIMCHYDGNYFEYYGTYIWRTN